MADDDADDAAKVKEFLDEREPKRQRSEQNLSRSAEEEAESNDAEGGDEEVLELLAAAAAARGIPLEWILQQALHEEGDDDDEEIEYPTLESLQDVARYIQQCKRIVVLCGAGMSVASGIPDFRSPNGLYATLQPELLTCNEVQRQAIRDDPTMALDHLLFLQNPLPCLELQRDFILGTQQQLWKATLAHRFLELLDQHHKLVRIYTQNIDGLQDQTSILPDKIVAVHGSMDRAECALCKSKGDFHTFCQNVESHIQDITKQDDTAPAQSTPIVCETCGHGTMKPAIVLFRSSLPPEFFQHVPHDTTSNNNELDLLMILGTSLRVAPANSLVWRVPKRCVRLLINQTREGEHLGMFTQHDSSSGDRDYFGQGDIERVVLQLMDHLGWLHQLQQQVRYDQLPEASAQLLREYLDKKADEQPDNDDDEEEEESNSEEDKKEEEEVAKPEAVE